MDKINQLVEETAMLLWDKWSLAIAQKKYVPTDTMEAIIKSAIYKGIIATLKTYQGKCPICGTRQSTESPKRNAL